MNHINNWITQLSAPLPIGGAALPVPGEALTRLGLGEGVMYTLVVVSSLDAMQQGDAEILHIGGAAGGGHTLQRAQEGTAERAWDTGAYIYCTITAATLDALRIGLSNALHQVAALASQLETLDARVAALEAGSGGELPNNTLVDSAGNALVNDLGDYLTYGA